MGRLANLYSLGLDADAEVEFVYPQPPDDAVELYDTLDEARDQVNKRASWFRTGQRLADFATSNQDGLPGYHDAGIGAGVAPDKKDRGLGELVTPVVLMVGIPLAIWLFDGRR